MKCFQRLIALLLCLSMAACLFGCDKAPEVTEPPVTEPVVTEPPAPDTAAVYADARSLLDSASALTLDTVVTTTTTVADQDFTQRSTQVLTYAGLGTDALQVSSGETLEYNPDRENDPEEASDPVVYKEIFTDGTVYVTMLEDYLFAAPLTAEECTARYLPAVLLDAALYGELTAEEQGDEILITFRQPTAGESWAVPEDSELVEAQGTARVSGGVLTEMTYCVHYIHGPAQVKLEVTSRPRASAEAVTVPENPDDYTVLQYADAPRLYLHAAGMMIQAESATVSSLESVMSQAAGVIRNQSTAMDLYGTGEDVMTKIETNVYLMDYSTGQDQQYKQEEVYRDSRYVLTIDDGVPTSQTGIPHETIEEYCQKLMLSHLNRPVFWVDAQMTDLGSLILVEFTCSGDFGNTMQNSICLNFWEDASFLNKLSSAYVNNETTSYIAFDKYTTLPTAAGYYYEGTHTIEGMDFVLSLQADQSIEIPSLGAYHEITEEMPEEAAPETPATPLFYHVTGENGQEMWLFGTIHVGDERTAYLPQEIKDAFTASDALALECDSEAFDAQLEEDDDLQDRVSDCYYYGNGQSIEAQMEEEEYALAVKFMKATGNYNMNMPYAKPYLWSSSIDQFWLRQGYQLHRDQGVEERLTAWAKEQNKEIREVESSLFQIQMLTGYSDELQMLMLRESMEYYGRANWESTWELYELWCTGDEEAMRAELNEEVDTSEMTEEELAEYEAEKPLIEEYNKAMSFDRNEGMLEVAIEYLESGEVIFYAVGLAHLLDNTNGLVEALREAGYTVELVAFAK